MNRKERRALKSQTNNNASSTIDLMLMLDDKCKICQAFYDKKDKNMAKEWFVEVFKEKKQVDLYCPKCYNIKKMLKESNVSTNSTVD